MQLEWNRDSDGSNLTTQTPSKRIYQDSQTLAKGLLYHVVPFPMDTVLSGWYHLVRPFGYGSKPGTPGEHPKNE